MTTKEQQQYGNDGHSLGDERGEFKAGISTKEQDIWAVGFVRKASRRWDRMPMFHDCYNPRILRPGTAFTAKNSSRKGIIARPQMPGDLGDAVGGGSAADGGVGRSAGAPTGSYVGMSAATIGVTVGGMVR